jgi:hypothetical protein
MVSLVGIPQAVGLAIRMPAFIEGVAQTLQPRSAMAATSQEPRPPAATGAREAVEVPPSWLEQVAKQIEADELSEASPPDGLSATPRGLDLAATPMWSRAGDQASAAFGLVVATAGDVDRDGYSDILVGAPSYDVPGGADAGRVFLYMGSASGPELSPRIVGSGTSPGALYGQSVASAGDVNGDGFHDVLVGAPGAVNSGLSGMVFLYLSDGNSVGGTAYWSDIGLPGTRFGASVSTAGDVNGDQRSDILIGEPSYDGGEPGEGRVFLYTVFSGHLGPWRAESDQAGAAFGSCVASAGDVNGDGFADVIIGAPGYDGGQFNEGRAFVYFGSSGGLGSSPTVLELNNDGAEFGFSVSLAGDVNGDG